MGGCLLKVNNGAVAYFVIYSHIRRPRQSSWDVLCLDRSNRLGIMDLLAELRSRKLLAIIRADGPDRAFACIRTLVDAGITALEVSLTTPGGVEAIAKARSRVRPGHPDRRRHRRHRRPGRRGRRRRRRLRRHPCDHPRRPPHVELGLPLLCGALTPTEVVAALDLGATAVKIFPAKVYGPGYLRDLRAPLPDAPLIAVGGVDAVSAPSTSPPALSRSASALPSSATPAPAAPCPN